jgi:hypothetical protein
MLKLAFFLFLGSVPLVTKADNAAPPITAEYLTEIKSGKSKLNDSWRFVRSGNHVAHERWDQTARWTRLSEREIALEHIFPKEKVVLEFTHSDMKARGDDLSWSSVTHVVDTNLLARLNQKGRRKLIGRVGTLYKGRIDAANWEILWFDDLKLAGRIFRRDKNGSMNIEVKRLQLGEVTQMELREYRRVDYADLGDLESDPTIQNLIRSFGNSHGHHHH